VFTDSDKVQERWKEYTENLYEKNNKPQDKNIHLETDTEDAKGPFCVDIICIYMSVCVTSTSIQQRSHDFYSLGGVGGPAGHIRVHAT